MLAQQGRPGQVRKLLALRGRHVIKVAGVQPPDGLAAPLPPCVDKVCGAWRNGRGLTPTSEQRLACMIIVRHQGQRTLKLAQQQAPQAAARLAAAAACQILSVSPAHSCGATAPPGCAAATSSRPQSRACSCDPVAAGRGRAPPRPHKSARQCRSAQQGRARQGAALVLLGTCWGVATCGRQCAGAAASRRLQTAASPGLAAKQGQTAPCSHLQTRIAHSSRFN